jgi:hypothetical protein
MYRFKFPRPLLGRVNQLHAPAALSKGELQIAVGQETVNSRGGLDAMEQTKLLTLPGFEIQPLGWRFTLSRIPCFQ